MTEFGYQRELNFLLNKFTCYRIVHRPTSVRFHIFEILTILSIPHISRAGCRGTCSYHNVTSDLVSSWCNGKVSTVERRKLGTQHYTEMVGQTPTLHECVCKLHQYIPLSQDTGIYNPTWPLPDLRNTCGYTNTHLNGGKQSRKLKWKETDTLSKMSLVDTLFFHARKTHGHVNIFLEPLPEPQV